MIWLASFPRSGNTFFRNVMFELYGLESYDYYPLRGVKVRKDYHFILLKHIYFPGKYSLRIVIYLLFIL